MKYSGTGGPGTLEITRLWITGPVSASRSEETIRTARPKVRGAANSAQSCSVSAGIALWCSLAFWLPSETSRSRSSGSSMSVPSREKIVETLLLPALFFDAAAHRDRHRGDQRGRRAARRARRGSGAARRRTRRCTTSLTVAPATAFLISLIFSSDMSAERDGPVAGDGAVERGARRAERRGHRRTARGRGRSCWSARSTRRARPAWPRATGLARLVDHATARAARRRPAYAARRRSSGADSSGGASGSRLHRNEIALAPETPSTVQWCILVNTATLPSTSEALDDARTPTAAGTGPAGCRPGGRTGRPARAHRPARAAPSGARAGRCRSRRR